MQNFKDVYDNCLQICKNLHKGQVDKAGAPYFLHPMRVADRCEDMLAKCVALLHDVVEDTGVTAEQLNQTYGVPNEVLDVVKLLTHGDEVGYFDYLQTQVMTNKTAVLVKMADLSDNMDLSRLKKITSKDLERVEKYKKAYAMLKDWLEKNSQF